MFVLLVPGYVFIAAFFPRKEDISDIERIALSFGFNICALGLIGVGLNYTPWLIRLDPLMACAVGFVVVCVYVSIVRRAAVPQAERFAVRARDVVSSARQIMPQSPTRFDKALTAIILSQSLCRRLRLRIWCSPRPAIHLRSFTSWVLPELQLTIRPNTSLAK